MSAVELPQVSSARSTSSRGSVQSAGSSASDRSNRSERNQRGHSISRPTAYGENSSGEKVNNDIESEEEDDDDEEEEEESEDGAGIDDTEEEPQESSGGLWDEVESFLNRPSPSLSVLTKSDKKKAASRSVLPTLKPDQLRRRVSEPESHRTGDGGAVIRTGGRPLGRSLYQSSSKAPSSKVIDPKLLQEAFAYAQKVSLMDNDDDQQEQAHGISEQRHPLARSSSRNFTTSSASSTSSSSSSLLGGKEGSGGSRIPPSHGVALKKQSSSGEVKGEDAKPRKKTASSKISIYGSSTKPAKKKSERRIKEAAQWDPSSTPCSSNDSASSEPNISGASRKHMDPQVMQSLVSNFQNGTTLDELRKELAASQQSMALSRQVLHDAAKAFFQPTGH